MKRIVIGISGASGAIYGIRILETLKGKAETHLIVTEQAKHVIVEETGRTINDVNNLASVVHDNMNLSAPLASGSFPTDGMVIVPCSIKTLSAVANSYSNNLLSRAADVSLKERRKLLLVVRETPLHLGHLQLMEKADLLGAIIIPPVPAFYHKPKTILEVIDHTIGKILEIIEIEHDLYKRWGT